MIINHSVASTITGLTSAADFSASTVVNNTSVSALGPTDITRNGVTYTGYQRTAGTRNKSDIVATPHSVATAPITFQSLTPEVCSVDTAGVITWVSDGSCTVHVSAGLSCARDITQTISSTSVTETAASVTNVDPNSFRTFLHAQQAAALAGVTPGSTAQRAAVNGTNGTMDPYGATFGAVNPNNFLRASHGSYIAPDLALLSELLASQGQPAAEWRAWITPHHFISWRGHDTIYAPGGPIQSFGGLWTDGGHEFTVEYSATAWTGSLCKLLPSNWTDYLPMDYILTSGIDCFCRMFNTYTANEARWVQPATLFADQAYDISDPRRAYQKNNGNEYIVSGGDSGSPIFAVLNGDILYIGHVAYLPSVGAASTMPSNYLGEVQSFIDSTAASGNFSLQLYDLSPFTNYQV